MLDPVWPSGPPTAPADLLLAVIVDFPFPFPLMDSLDARSVSLPALAPVLSFTVVVEVSVAAIDSFIDAVSGVVAAVVASYELGVFPAGV